MDVLSMLLQGFAVCFTWENILAVIIGVLVGTLTGAAGYRRYRAMALLLPISFGMDGTTALIMFAGIYYGAMYGGSTTSILVNLPGKLHLLLHAWTETKWLKGRAGAALSISAIGSFVAGTFGLVGLSFFAPWLAKVALRFGPPEYFAIAILGLVLLTNLTGENPLNHSLWYWWEL